MPRYALNIKGLPYKTEWLSFTGVEPKMKELGLAAQGGPLLYTIPTIYDPNNDKIVTESFAIAKYLDQAYPDTPRLVMPGAAGFQEAYLEKVVSPLLNMIIPSIAMPVFEECCIDDADRAYVRDTREKWFGRKFEDMEWKREAMTAASEAFKVALDAIATRLLTSTLR
ncbi:unnamed protein product [Peniophora sp. CBMAI 1063]|nr:unnamed protein product [Peniophora sp. CBMAI 1063]